jgi:hypothetical protein
VGEDVIVNQRQTHVEGETHRYRREEIQSSTYIKWTTLTAKQKDRKRGTRRRAGQRRIAYKMVATFSAAYLSIS